MFEKIFGGKNKQEKLEIKELPKQDAVVVLGSMVEKDKDGKDILSIQAKMRLIAALELFQRGLAGKIILSGGLTQKGQEKSEAELMADFLKQNGISEEYMFLEKTSKNTSENLLNTLKILDKEKLNKVTIETSEYHLKRAMQIFSNILKEAGLNVGYEEIVGLKIDGIDVEGMSAEDILEQRSPHYKKLIEGFKFPTALAENPAQALKLGIREFLRRVIISIDKDDKIARFMVHMLRRS